MRRLLNDLLLGHMLNISTLRHWEICNNINVFALPGSLDTSQVQLTPQSLDLVPVFDKVKVTVLHF